jgi:NADPH2:quinone reductase
MRALMCREFGPPEKLVVEQIDDPQPGAGQVLVQIKAAALNFPDVLVVRGQYQTRTPPPFIPGGEAAGIVAAVGEGVKGFRPGDRVIATTMQGAFAEQCAVAQEQCMPLPRPMSFEEGAAFTVTYATSYHALRQSTRLSAGETLLVLGAAGGVGSSAVEIGKALGARVIAGVSNAEKAAFAKAAGADETVNYSDTELRVAIRELTDGKGVDVVYDPVGGDLAEQAFRSLGWHGRYLVIGFASGAIPQFAANIALLKEASIIGVWWGTWAMRNPDPARRNMVELSAMVADGKLRPRVTETFPLDRFAHAFAAITERRAQGKIVLTMD